MVAADRKLILLIKENFCYHSIMRSERKYLDSYVKFLKKFLEPRRKLKVVFDCSNGTTGIILKELFRRSNVVVVFINDKPDGNFPAHGPNPMAKGAVRQLAKEVLKRKADLGVIFDADGDRVFFVDNRGRAVDSNETGFILMQRHRPPYVVGVTSSWRLKKLSGVKSPFGGRKVYESKVGHYFFKKLMRKYKANLGLEHSGHYYFRKFFYSDSGILAAIEVINFISKTQSGLASWLDGLPRYYRSGEINFKVKDKEGILKRVERIYKAKQCKIYKIDGLTVEFKNGWFNLRPSNTENLMRLNVEFSDKKTLRKILGEAGKEIGP